MGKNGYESKSEIVDTLNHELRHQFQDKLISKYNKYFILGGNKESDSVFSSILNLLGLKKSKTLSPEFLEEKQLAKIFRDNKRHYKDLPSSEVTLKEHPELLDAYWNQPVEVDARKAGAEAKAEFTSLMDSFASKRRVLSHIDWNKKQISTYLSFLKALNF